MFIAKRRDLVTLFVLHTFRRELNQLFSRLGDSLNFNLTAALLSEPLQGDNHVQCVI